MAYDTSALDAANAKLDDLTDEYRDWLDDNRPGFPVMSADELLAIAFCELTSKQTAWLSDFCLRWDVAQEEADFESACYARRES